MPLAESERGPGTGFFAAGAVLAGLAVAAGAFGAHALKNSIGEPELVTFETGARYHMYHALALLVVGRLISRRQNPPLRAAGWLFIAGIVLFSGSLYGLALTGVKPLAYLTPVGGVAFLLGWACLALGSVRGSGRPTSRPLGPGACLYLLSLGAVGCGGDPANATHSSSAAIASVTVTPNPAEVAVAATLQLTATPRDSDGNTVTGRTVTWTTGNSSFATVSASGLATGVAPGTVTITATSGGTSGTATLTVTAASPPASPRFGHVFIVMEENTDYADVIGSSQMPYFNSLAARYGVATQYYANTHPSIGNYFMLTTGQIITNNDSYSGTVSADNIVRRLIAAGKTWKAYAEDLPSVGYLTIINNGSYLSRHNPVVYFSDVRNDPNQARNVVPFTQLATDLANGTLPDWAMIVPNTCDDAHDCSLGTADNWLSTRIAPLIANPVFQQDGLLIVVFDESGADDNTNGGGRIAWLAVSGKAKSGYQSATLYQHQSTLRLMLEALGITSFPGASSTAPEMGEFFNP